MATITSPGLGSGLDINGLVNQLVQVQRLPQTQSLDKKEAELQARLSAFGTLKGALSSLQTSLASLKTLATYQGRSIISSDTKIATATTSTSSPPGKYELSVTELAAAHKLATDPVNIAGARFTSVTDNVGTGTLTFKFGTTVYDSATDAYTSFSQNADQATHSVTITDGSLKGVRDAINDAEIGVSASIVYDGSYYRLSLSVDNTGADHSMEITADDDDLNDVDNSGLSMLAFNSGATHLEQTKAAQDTVGLTIDGIPISSASNKLTDAVEGTTINLLDVGSVTLTISLDTENVSKNIQTLVAKYNALITTINDLSKYDPETKQAGLLNGDGVLRSINSQLRRVLGDPVQGLNGPFKILADIGITRSSSDGTLVLDNAKLSKAIDDNFEDIAGLFAAVGKPSDSLIGYQSASERTLVGSYAVSVTQLATQGMFTGSAAANLTISGGVNDSISVSINGTAATVTLSAGTYTFSSLAAEVQSQINGTKVFSDLGLSVKVTESGGVLTLTSGTYGSVSKVNVSGGNGRQGLFGASPIVTDGVDVGGTIGGVEATGEGQSLTGTGAATGLKLKVIGGGIGDRGTVNFTRGYAESLENVLSGLLKEDGIFDSVNDNIDRGIKEINDRREVVERRVTAFEERIRAQFIAMDLLVSQLQSTSAYLGQQLARLPTIGSDQTGNK